MQNYKCKVSKDGRVVIPAPFRKSLRILPGDEMVISLSEGVLNVVNAEQSLKDFQKEIQALTKGASLVDELIQMRREDFRKEEKDMNLH